MKSGETAENPQKCRFDCCFSLVKLKTEKGMELTIYKNHEFGSIRATNINGEPWFVGKDVADVLGYQNASKALNDHVEPEDKLNNESLSSLGQRGGWLINESGVYSLIFGSKLPGAKRFKHWVTSEVLPAIRMTKGSVNWSPPAFLADCLRWIFSAGSAIQIPAACF